jgi:acetyltransferase-like isoleucine patch superfamily enzyme
VVLQTFLKRIVLGIALVLAFPAALCSGFGRMASVYNTWAHVFAQLPGLPGDYLRIAYYHLTLERCPLDSRIHFGSFFVHPQARIGHKVHIGCYCVVGRTDIGDRTHIASGTHILSGTKQHSRTPDGRLRGGEVGIFETISIGEDCWVGAGALVMAELGAQCTIGAGSVVTRAIPAGAIAVGSPARVLESHA